MELTIAIGSDHRGFPLKEKLIDFLESKNFVVIDFGTHSEESVDYPDYSFEVAKCVTGGGAHYGISICGSGIGVSIAANKIKGARAVNATSGKITEMSRRHNDANVICFGSDFVDFESAVEYFTIFTETEFEQGERHIRRVNKLNNL